VGGEGKILFGIKGGGEGGWWNEATTNLSRKKHERREKHRKDEKREGGLWERKGKVPPPSSFYRKKKYSNTTWPLGKEKKLAEGMALVKRDKKRKKQGDLEQMGTTFADLPKGVIHSPPPSKTGGGCATLLGRQNRGEGVTHTLVSHQCYFPWEGERQPMWDKKENLRAIGL